MVADERSALTAPQKVFVVSEFVDKTKNSTGYYWFKTIAGLSEQGLDVQVISTEISCDAAKSSDSSVKYIPIRALVQSKKGGLFERIMHQLALSFQLIKLIFKHVSKDDIVFSGTNPAFMLIFISIAKSIIGFKWILLVHDVFPENLVPAKLLKKKSLFYRILKYIFDHAYSNANVLIAIGRDMQDLLIQKTGSKEKTKYVPNWIDLKDIKICKDLSECYVSAKLQGKTVFQFFGNIGRVQGIDNILRAIAKLKSDKAVFLFVGGGAEQSKVKDFIQKNPHLNVVFNSSVPLEKNNEVLSSSDVAIIPLTTGMLGLGVPSKAYFSLAADKPILVVGDQNAELDLVIKENPDIGWSCRAEDPDALALIFEDIIKTNLDEKKDKPRSFVTRKYGIEQAISHYVSIIKSLDK